MEINKNSELFDKLTNIDEDNSLNFLESLKYLGNAKVIMQNLNRLKEEGIEFKIIKGFISSKIKEDEEFNEFKNCVIESSNDLSKFTFANKIKDNTYVINM